MWQALKAPPLAQLTAAATCLRAPTFGRDDQAAPFPRSPVDNLHDVYELLLVGHRPVHLQRKPCARVPGSPSVWAGPCKESSQQRTLLLFPVPRSIMMCCAHRQCVQRRAWSLLNKARLQEPHLIPEEKHDGAGVVQLVHGVEVRHLATHCRACKQLRTQQQVGVADGAGPRQIRPACTPLRCQPGI